MKNQDTNTPIGALANLGSARRASQTVQGLDMIQLAIANTLAEPEILNVLSGQGYNQSALQSAHRLCSDAVAQSNRLVSMGGTRKAVTVYVRETRQALRKAVGRFSRVCRTLFRQEEAVLVKLGLKGQGPMPHADADFIDRARVLFNTTEYTPEMRAKLATRKYDDAKFSAERGRIEAFHLARQQSAAARGAQQQGTQEKRAALKAAREWYRDFRATAKVELADQPQMLEKLGISVRRQKTKAQREGPRKAAETRRRKKIAKIAA